MDPHPVRDAATQHDTSARTTLSFQRDVPPLDRTVPSVPPDSITTPMVGTSSGSIKGTSRLRLSSSRCVTGVVGVRARVVWTLSLHECIGRVQIGFLKNYCKRMKDVDDAIMTIQNKCQSRTKTSQKPKKLKKE